MQMENLFYQLMEPSPGILKSLGQSGDDENLLVFFFSIKWVKLTNHLLILLTSHDNLFYFIFKVF